MSAKDAKTEADERDETRRLALIRAQALKDEADLQRQLLEAAQFVCGYN
jgi:hypothetical protein